MAKEYIPPTDKNVCDLDNCFAHSDKSDTCTILKQPIQVGCPFYKPVPMKNGHKTQSTEWHEDKVSRETRRYAKNRVKQLKKEVRELNKAIRAKESEIKDAEGAQTLY